MVRGLVMSNKVDLENIVVKYMGELPLTKAVQKIADIVYELGYADGYLQGLEANRQDGNETRNQSFSS